ncbi:HAPLN3 [Branchiostoma lanceolatum]|uniref:HAPLN3 protein n=1 Tax=Branchiostoma lanceolatum TaxID=7740 RepID=A0A8K0AIH5_BRALA|nr:HAPLN3 [Branchiostoma lanceolatum]
MAPRFILATWLFVTFVFLCSAQSVCKPPPEEKCACNQVVNVGTDDGLKSELDRLKTVVEQLSQKTANWSEARVSTLEEQLAQEQTIRAEMEVTINRIQETLDAHLQDTTTQQGELAEKLKTDLCTATPKLGELFHVQSPAGEYKYDLDEARQACAEQNASLASYHQLLAAWQDGLEKCACGWLSDGTRQYPMQTDRGQGCGGRAGIITCEHNSSNAWCYRGLSVCD